MAEGGGAGRKRQESDSVDPDRPYPMDLPRLGHAVIVNNVAMKKPGSRQDVAALKMAYETIGFDVQIHNDCNVSQIRNIRKWILTEENHADSNCFAFTIIAHGNDKGHLLDRNRKLALYTELFIADLSDVKTLNGKPKIITIQSCRSPSESASETLADEDDDVESAYILPDKADMFLAYATVPGYKAHAGGEEGSVYLQTFAKYLLQEYKKRPLDKIMKMVRQHMVKTVQGNTDGMQQCPEERNSLIYDVRFSEFRSKESEGKKVQETVTNNEGEMKEKTEIPEQPEEERAKMEDELKKTMEKPKIVERQRKGEKAEMKRLSTGRVQFLIKTISKSFEENKQLSRPSEPSAKVTGQNIKRPLITSVFPPPPPPPIAPQSGNSHDSTMPLSCRALYDYQAQAVDEITLRKDDVITKVAKPKGCPWWTGEVNGQRGFFPANYVEEIKNAKVVAMKLLSIHDTSLPFWHATGMSSSPSEDAVILFCKMSEEEPPAFVFFDLKTFGKGRVIKALCEHERGVNMLPVTVDNKKLLAVLCADCQVIRLLNLENNTVTIAVQDKELRPGAPCIGNANQMFCLHMVIGFPVIGIDWSTTEFKVEKIFETGLGSISGITYVPSENVIAVSDAKGGFIRALMRDTGKTAWEVNKLPDSSPFTPYSLDYSVKHNCIIVCAKNKILRLNPSDGSIVQIIVPQESTGFAGDVCVFDDEAAILHKSPDGKWKFSKYSMQ